MGDAHITCHLCARGFSQNALSFTCLLPFPKNLLPLSLYITQTFLLLYLLFVWIIWVSLILEIQVLSGACFCSGQSG